ncbi:MAG: hypothetical protein ACPL1K_05525, partial [Candidatus Kryptoniota bacterium]
QKCGYVTLTADQAKRLQLLQRISFAEGRVKRTGHHLAIVFPEDIVKMGIRSGQKVIAQSLGKGSLKIDVE